MKINNMHAQNKPGAFQQPILKQKHNHAPAWLLAVVCLALLFSPFGFVQAIAQTPDGVWAPARNLSNAGASSNPVFVTDANGITHATWLDQFAGNRYAQLGPDGVWSNPTQVYVPFTRSWPRLIAGPDNLIFAFWIGEDNMLRSSRVLDRNFGLLNSWGAPRMVMRNVLSFDVELDANGMFHLIFTTNKDATNQPAGVYYLQSLAGGGSWGAIQPIYASPYFRSLLPESAPHVSVSRLNKGEKEGEPGPIFLAWDAPSQQQTLLSRSVDGGKTWEPAQAVGHPDANSDVAPASEGDLTSWNEEMVLVWKKGTSPNNCTMMFQTTGGGGASWSSARALLAEDSSCPTQSTFLGGRSDTLLWQAMINNQVYLAAWNGQFWSALQQQADLSAVKDPTTAQTLSTGCHQLEYLPQENRLNAISCDVGGNQDIWFTTIKLSGLKNWFTTQDSGWSAAQPLASAAAEVSSLNLVSDEHGSFYAMWVQPQPGSDPAAGNNAFATVMYSAWDGQTWSQPTQTFRPLDGGARDMAVTINATGELMAVWRGENPGQIFFSRANADSAFSAQEWTETINLPTPGGPCLSPYILAGANSDIFVAYAVPANEGQGIYLNHSTDNGHTWSEPVRIFDAQSAGWELSRKPALRMAADGQLYAFWQRGSLLLDGLGVGLGFSRSEDNGVTWSEPDLSIEARVRWASGAAAAPGQLFRVWQETTGSAPAIISQTSADGGRTWEPPVSITISGEMLGAPNLVTDADGTIHLLQMSRNSSGGVVLIHWIWNTSGWTAGENLSIEQPITGGAGTVSGAISPQKKFAILYTTDDTVNGGLALQAVIGAVAQAGAAPVTQPQPAATAPRPTQPVQTSASPTPEPSPTEPALATMAPELIDDEVPPASSNNGWTGLIFSSVLAVVIVTIIFGYRVVQSRRRGGFYKR